jgi:hypothetical protein
VEKGRNALVYRFHLRGNHAELEECMKTVRKWIKECRGFDQGRKGPEYGLTIALYPVKQREEAKQ